MLRDHTSPCHAGIINVFMSFTFNYACKWGGAVCSSRCPAAPSILDKDQGRTAPACKADPYDPRVPRGRTSSLVLHRSVLPLYVAHLLLRVLSCCLFLLVEPAVEGAPSSWSASGQRRHAKHSRRPLINDEVLPPPPKPWRSSICYSDPSGQGSQAEDIFWKWASIPWPPSWTLCDAAPASTPDAPSCKACVNKSPEKRAGKQRCWLDPWARISFG
jgi:hypothetical protein